MAETVEPRVSRGLRDLLPAEMLARQWMIDTIRGVYELYGFVPLVNPRHRIPGRAARLLGGC